MSARREHAEAHGAECECRAFEVEQVIAEQETPLPSEVTEDDIKRLREIARLIEVDSGRDDAQRDARYLHSFAERLAAEVAPVAQLSEVAEEEVEAARLSLEKSGWDIGHDLDGEVDPEAAALTHEHLKAALQAARRVSQPAREGTVGKLKRAIELALSLMGPGPNMSEYGHFREDCALVHMDHFEGLGMAASGLIDALSEITGESPTDLCARLVPTRPCDCKSCVGEEAAEKARAAYLADLQPSKAGLEEADRG